MAVLHPIFHREHNDETHFRVFDHKVSTLDGRMSTVVTRVLSVILIRPALLLTRF